MLNFITNHPFIVGCIVFFIIAAIFMLWEMHKAPFENTSDTETKD